MAEAARTFITIARTDDVPPGARLVVELGRKWIVVFNVDGTYYALEDMCSHDEVPLSEGELIDDTTIQCSAHGACFDLRTGGALGPPAVVGVKRYDVRVEDNELQIATT